MLVWPVVSSEVEGSSWPWWRPNICLIVEGLQLCPLCLRENSRTLHEPAAGTTPGTCRKSVQSVHPYTTHIRMEGLQ